MFVSSHLMSEMALTADHLVILGRGRLLADVSLAAMTASSATVRVRSPQADRLRQLLTGPDVTVTGEHDRLSVTGRDTEQVARIAFTHGVLVTELTAMHASLEEAYLSLTHDAVEYQPTTASPADHATATWRAAA